MSACASYHCCRLGWEQVYTSAKHACLILNSTACGVPAASPGVWDKVVAPRGSGLISPCDELVFCASYEGGVLLDIAS